MTLQIFFGILLSVLSPLRPKPFSNPIFSQAFNFTAAAAKGPTDNAGNPVFLGNRGIAYWETVHNNQGTASACAYTLQGSDDGATWSGTIITVASCTTDGVGTLTAISTASSYVRVNVSSYTSTSQNSNLTVTMIGFPVNN